MNANVGGAQEPEPLIRQCSYCDGNGYRDGDTSSNERCVGCNGSGLEPRRYPDAGRLASELMRIAGGIEATVDNHHGHPLHWSDSEDVQAAARILRRLAPPSATDSTVKNPNGTP